MKSDIQSVNATRKNFTKAAVTINTTRPVNTVQPRTAVNNAGPIKNVINNAYSTARSPINNITTSKNSKINQKVNTVRAKKVNTARPKAVLNVVQRNHVTTKVKNINGEAQLHAKVDEKKVVIPEASIRRDLQFGDEGETVIDEAINEEMYDNFERATTTATSLDAEQDRGGGPWRKDTIRDTIAQTRSENVSKFSNDLPLSRVNTLRSGEDRLKLKELMELYTKLSDRVLNLETTKTAQAKEIDNLKKRVKRLERKRKSRSHGLKDYT
nr:hypothetical protein [Tanacetum cinerariifolium]